MQKPPSWLENYFVLGIIPRELEYEDDNLKDNFSGMVAAHILCLSCTSLKKVSEIVIKHGTRLCKGITKTGVINLLIIYLFNNYKTVIPAFTQGCNNFIC